MARPIKVIVERHPDGYIAYPLGVRGVVVGEGDTYDEALQDIRSAIRFHVDTFGSAVLLDAQEEVMEAFVAETAVPVE